MFPSQWQGECGKRKGKTKKRSSVTGGEMKPEKKKMKKNDLDENECKKDREKEIKTTEGMKNESEKSMVGSDGVKKEEDINRGSDVADGGEVLSTCCLDAKNNGEMNEKDNAKILSKEETESGKEGCKEERWSGDEDDVGDGDNSDDKVEGNDKVVADADDVGAKVDDSGVKVGEDDEDIGKAKKLNSDVKEDTAKEHSDHLDNEEAFSVEEDNEDEEESKGCLLN